VAKAETGLIRVRPYNRIFNGREVSLLSIVEGSDLLNETRTKLSAVSLGDAPKMGEQRVYTNAAIAEAIRRSAIKKSWSIQIPYQVVVENKGYEVDRETVEKQLISNWSQLCQECQIAIQTLQLPNMPKENNQFPWTLSADTKIPRGNFSSKMSVMPSSGRELVYWVNGTIEIKKKVPVLVRSTPMNTRLTTDDFKMEWRVITQATDSNPKPEEIVGQKAKFSMNSDDIIWSGSLVREKAGRNCSRQRRRSKLASVDAIANRARWLHRRHCQSQESANE
jgi:hypothetical protein